MGYKSFEAKLKSQIEAGYAASTPGLQVQAYWQGKKVASIEVGNTFAYYDLASLTKVIATVPAAALAFQEKGLALDARVKYYLPWFMSAQTTVSQLLTHTSGLSWWEPFFKQLEAQNGVANWQKLPDLIAATTISDSPKAVYSDLGFMTLGLLLEKVYEKSFFEIWQELKTKFYAKSSFEFHPGNVPPHKSNLYAPTGRCTIRNYNLQGEVNDQNTYALGGVSSHAGLFGSVDDVSWFGLFIRSHLLKQAHTLFKNKTIETFTKRAIPESQGDWALGFMLPTPGLASSGIFFSRESIGHTGFTGTSIWYDPRQDLLVTILSNRVAFGVDHQGFKEFRPKIHDWIIEGLKNL